MGLLFALLLIIIVVLLLFFLLVFLLFLCCQLFAELAGAKELFHRDDDAHNPEPEQDGPLAACPETHQFVVSDIPIPAVQEDVIHGHLRAQEVVEQEKEAQAQKKGGDVG